MEDSGMVVSVDTVARLVALLVTALEAIVELISLLRGGVGT